MTRPGIKPKSPGSENYAKFTEELSNMYGEACFSKKKYLQIGKIQVFHYEPKSIRRSVKWKHTDSPVEKDSGRRSQ